VQDSSGFLHVDGWLMQQVLLRVGGSKQSGGIPRG
jgi:hypothetical protein